MAEFWSLLSPDERADFARRSRRRRWRRGEVLIREADGSDWVMLLESGRVKATSHTANGTEIVLAVRRLDPHQPPLGRRPRPRRASEST